MSAQHPQIDILITRERDDTFRLRFAPFSWMPPTFSARADAKREIAPVAAPDASELERLAWETDAPMQIRRIVDGGIEVQAAGRSAVVLHEYLADLVRPL